ncbi:MAG: hypothetical protein PSW75_08555 [bacterium]|nr:hypothetical protein [bacterium]
MTPGPRNDPVLDWSYWLWLRAAPSPIALLADGAPRQPVKVESAANLRQAEFNGRFITVALAPALFEFTATPDLFELSGGFGLLDTSWTGSDKTGPVAFVVSLRAPDGKETKLLERTLDPAKVAADRGVQSFNFTVPQPATGTLRFVAKPRTGRGKAEAFWSQLSATLLRTSLRFHDEVLPALPESRGQFGFLNTDEGGRDCLVAHASSTLVYAWREGLTRLTAAYGLKAAAYTSNDTEGVIFVVETEDAQGVRRELFRRHLAPKTRAEDRGDQPLSVEIPPRPGGRIFLHTLPPPSGHLNAAWSYWRELRGDR